MALASDDGDLSLSFPGRHPGSLLATLCLQEKQTLMPHAPRWQSVLLVPMGSLGTKVIRPLTVYRLEDVPR